MTADLFALEARLLAPLRRATEDAATRLGMALDPDRELPEAGPAGDAAATAITREPKAGPDSPRHMAGGTAHPAAQALDIQDGPRVTQHVEPQALQLAARAADAANPARMPVRAGLAADEAAEVALIVSGQMDGTAIRQSSPGQPRSTTALPPGAQQMEERQARLAEVPNAPVGPPSGPKLFSPEVSPPSAVPLAPGIAAAPASSPTQIAPGRSAEAPSPPSSLPLRAPQDSPAVRAAEDPAPAFAVTGQAAQPHAPGGDTPSGRAAAVPDFYAHAPALPGGSPGQAPKAPATAAPEEPFAGLIPVRIADTQARPGSAAAPAESLYPVPASPASAHPALGEVARAMQPVFARAAALDDAAWDDEAPSTAPPSVSNTFNVTVAMAGNAGPVEREALQDALADLLRDAARRQGLDL